MLFAALHTVNERTLSPLTLSVSDAQSRLAGEPRPTFEHVSQRQRSTIRVLQLYHNGQARSVSGKSASVPNLVAATHR